jgi:superfamily I DNA/RNA helicase
MKECFRLPDTRGTFKDRYPKADQIHLEDNFRSSQGIVETARAFIEQNALRLPKAMQPANAQPYEPGDICALQFDTPEAEAAHIVAAAQALRGVAFKEPSDKDPDHHRGLSWSDMAILLRSVSGNGEPITQPEEVTEAQLHVYALGYQELTGKNADLVEIYELDDRKRKPRAVDDDFIKDVKTKVAKAAKDLRAGNLDPDPTPAKCKRCDYHGMCSHGAKACAN